MYSVPFKGKGLPSKTKERSGRSGTFAQSTWYCPFQDLVAPIWELSISAMSVGSTMRDVPARSQKKHENYIIKAVQQGQLTGVNRGTGILEFQFVISEGHTLNFDLPVSLATNRDIGNLAGVRIVVDTTEDSLATVLLRGTETEGEDRRVEQALVNHAVER